MEQLSREELKSKLRDKIQSKSNSRKYSINKKKGNELQEKLNSVKNILSENSINSLSDLNESENNNTINEKINSILSSEDIKYLLTKLSNNPELINILKNLKSN